LLSGKSASGPEGVLIAMYASCVPALPCKALCNWKSHQIKQQSEDEAADKTFTSSGEGYNFGEKATPRRIYAGS